MTLNLRSQICMAARQDNVIGKLLVVDDNEMNRDTLSRRLIRAGHTVDLADGGRPALDMIPTGQYDAVLLDVMMPDVDGFEVLEKVRETLSPEQLPIIMVTAKTDSDTIVAALKLGANDYVTKPLDYPVVRARIQTQLALKKARENLAKAHDRMKHDLEAAAEIQRASLPEEFQRAGYQFDWRFFPCEELGGDGLKFTALDDDNVVICLWDVAGHGVSAGLLSVSIAHMLSPGLGRSTLAFEHNDGKVVPVAPAVVAHRLNERFPMDENASRFFTLCYGVLNTRTGTFRYVSAGHPAPVLINSDGVALTEEAETIGGVPIGMVSSNVGDYQENEITLSPGDRMYIYSDGFDEQSNAEDVLFGKARLSKWCTEQVQQSVDNVAEKLYDHLLSWSESTGLSDDASMIVIERNRA